MPDSPRPRDGPDDVGTDADADAPGGRDDAGEGGRIDLSAFDDDGEYQRPPLEPGSPSAENVFFVLIGVALTLLLLLSVFVPVPFVG